MSTATRAAPDRIVVAVALRQVRRGAVVVALLSAGMSAIVVATARNEALDRTALAALAANPAIRTLFGEPVAIDLPGGFTVWRTGTVVAVLVGAWSLLTATRITRGEEDAGRWDLLLAGRIPLTHVVGGHLGVLVGAALLVGGAVAVAMKLAGAGASGAVVHGSGVALAGAFFAGVGTLAAQVFASRSAASGAAAGVLGVALLVRMIGDGVTALGWVRWLSPFGLLALTRPYDTNRWAPLAVLAVATVVVGGLAARSAGHRDAGGALLPSSTGRAARRALLGSPAGFAVRRTLRPFAGWSLGIGAYFVLIGCIARSMTAFLAGNPRFADLAEQAGFAGLDTVDGYAATLFALLAVPVGVFAALRVAALAADETSRRLVPVLAAPVTRLRLVTAEATVALLAATALATVAAIATWAGATTVGADLLLGGALAGTLNVLPVVLLCLGAAVLALGWAPRAVAAVGALPAVGGFLWLVTADSIGAPPWARGLSPFAHLAAVPAAAPDWPAATVMAAVATGCAAVGVLGYRRRDIRG